MNDQSLNRENNQKLVKAITDLTKMVDQLRSQRYLSMVDRPIKFLFYNFLSGIASGLGTVIGATIIITLIIILLARLETLPYIGKEIQFVVESLKQGMQR
jgi:hypothetical protein